MNHDEQLHETIVNISRSSRLKNKHVLVTNRLSDRNTSLSVGVVQAHSVCDINAESEIYQQLAPSVTGAASPPEIAGGAQNDDNIPTGDLGTDLRVGAPRDEFDFVRHLVQHCQRREEKRAGRRIFGGEE
jgi:hypothetical protein